jgi:hypothetical protein
MRFQQSAPLALACSAICSAIVLMVMRGADTSLTVEYSRVPKFQLNSLSGDDDSSMLLSRFSNANAPPRLFMLKSRGATFANATAVQSGDQLGEIRWLAADGRDFVTVAADIVATVSGTVSTGIVPTRLHFRTRDASGGIAERASILPGGALVAGDGNSGVDPGSEGLLVEGKFATLSGSLTTASGAVTVVTSMAVIDTQSATPSDDLDTINGGVNGMSLYVRAANDARTLVVKDGTGNIQGPGDCILDNTQDIAHLIFDSALNAWLVVACSNNGG